LIDEIEPRIYFKIPEIQIGELFPHFLDETTAISKFGPVKEQLPEIAS
jgi:hypothetical protein